RKVPRERRDCVHVRSRLEVGPERAKDVSRPRGLVLANQQVEVAEWPERAVRIQAGAGPAPEQDRLESLPPGVSEQGRKVVLLSRHGQRVVEEGGPEGFQLRQLSEHTPSQSPPREPPDAPVDQPLDPPSEIDRRWRLDRRAAR